ncbi:MAG: hypothetical protein NZM29_03340, partial [Nitrospira sp.]|nr:hypothetical protein [Nitrospira sp.]
DLHESSQVGIEIEILAKVTKGLNGCQGDGACGDASNGSSTVNQQVAEQRRTNPLAPSSERNRFAKAEPNVCSKSARGNPRGVA